ncbi:MAG: DUF2207 domain-containing protein [Candidatus Levybacteria bacterium]|nr:DUF2207 domain-containing protein [Candidatus Levybacteria bacterium]
MKKIFLIFAFIFGLFLILKPQTVFAESINSFDTKITAHKDGSMDIEENIEYFFDSERHGIFRFIPTVSRVGDLYRIIEVGITDVKRDGRDETFDITKNKNEASVKIGDPDRTISGVHRYTIRYIVKNGIGSNFPDFDEIYWNVTGNDWQITIEEASIKFETDFGVSPVDLICFTGQMGSTNKNCLVEENRVITLQTLSAGEGLTAVAKYPKGTFPESILQKSPPTTFGEKVLGFFIKFIWLFWIILNIIISALLIHRYRRNRNKTKYGKPAVNFDIPKDAKGRRITPAEAGTIDTARLERDDVLATIFDLAVRKYLKMEEIKKPSKVLGFLGKKENDQKIIKLKEKDPTTHSASAQGGERSRTTNSGQDEKLNDFEKVLFDRLFKNGDEIEVSSLKKDFYKTFSDMEKELFEDLVSRGFYVKNPKNQKAAFLVFGIIALSTGNFILSAVLFALSFKLNGRTQLGDEADHKIDGLKIFLRNVDRNFTWQAKKFYTVEEMIPYAVALGYIDEFMEQLKIAKPDYNPSWYRGTSFYTAYPSFYSGLNSNMTTSAPSSSSGSFGGSSGGGGGGGGGGSW